MSQIRYIDGFDKIHFINGMVRIDMYQLTSEQDGNDQKKEPSEQIVMTPQTFVESLSAMQQLAEKLTEAGILQRQ